MLQSGVIAKRRDRKAAMKFLRKLMKRYGSPTVIVTDRLRSYGAAMKVIGNVDKQEIGRWKNNRAENSHLPFRRRERAMLRFGGEKEGCCDSGVCEVCKNSSPFILQFTTILTRNDISTTDRISSSTAPPLSPNGGSFVPRRFRRIERY